MYSSLSFRDRFDILSEETQPRRVGIAKSHPVDKDIVKLSIDGAIKRTLASSPEISIVSYDPSIAKEDIVKAAAK